MNLDGFKTWLSNQMSHRVVINLCSRLNKLQHVLDLDIDKEYEHDQCKYLLSLFSNRGDNPQMKYHLFGDLPIGRESIHPYKTALNKYVNYKNQLSVETKHSKSS